MKIQEAVNKFDKFRRTEWKKDKYLHFQACVLVNQDGRPAYLGKASFSSDWEEYKEPKETLWDKQTRLYDDCDCCNVYGFEIDDVKEALKEFIKGIFNETYGDQFQSLQYKAKEVFGEEMLK